MPHEKITKKRMANPIPILDAPPKIEGTAQIILFRDTLWPDLEAKGVDLSTVERNASALEYLNLWKSEAEARWPETPVKDAQCRPGLGEALVGTNTNHPRGAEITKGLIRLGMQLYLDHTKWLVKVGSPRHRYWAMRFGDPLPEEEDVYADDGNPNHPAGGEGDSPEGGSGQPAADESFSTTERHVGPQIRATPNASCRTGH